MRAHEYRTGLSYSHPGDDWTDRKPYESGIMWYRTPAESQRCANLLRALGNVVTEVTR